MDADTEATIDVVLVQQPAHGHQHEMEVIHSRALHHPIDTASHELKKRDIEEYMSVERFDLFFYDTEKPRPVNQKRITYMLKSNNVQVI